VLAGGSVFHIAALHQYGSSNPIGVHVGSNTLGFGSYFVTKDLLGALWLALCFSLMVFFGRTSKGGVQIEPDPYG
jgi:ubiquinol-cytochrome c reductase cytochrome b subunit